jgi:hypothetical protein
MKPVSAAPIPNITTMAPTSIAIVVFGSVLRLMRARTREIAAQFLKHDEIRFSYRREEGGSPLGPRVTLSLFRAGPLTRIACWTTLRVARAIRPLPTGER